MDPMLSASEQEPIINTKLDTRLQEIIAAYESGQITVDNAKQLIQDPTQPSPKVSKSMTVRPTGVTFEPEAPHLFFFENFRGFLTPTRYGRPTSIIKNPKVVLPVTPESFEVSLANNASSFSTITGKTHSHAGALGLEVITFEGILPWIEDRDNLPTYVSSYIRRFGIHHPNAISTMFRRSMRANQPIRFGITRVNNKGNFKNTVYGPLVVTIKDFSVKVNHGHNQDLFFNMTLERWHPQTVGIAGLGNSSTSGNGSNSNSNDGTNASKKKYTVKKGDYLYKIAQEQLGDARRWREIYNLNKEKIGSNPNLIYPGQVFILPKR